MHRFKKFSSNIKNIQSILKTSTFSPPSNKVGGLMSCFYLLLIIVQRPVFPKTIKTFIDIPSIVPMSGALDLAFKITSLFIFSGIFFFIVAQVKSPQSPQMPECHNIKKPLPRYPLWQIWVKCQAHKLGLNLPLIFKINLFMTLYYIIAFCL